MVFEGCILGDARKIQGNPYLNSTTILFDKGSKIKINDSKQRHSA